MKEWKTLNEEAQISGLIDESKQRPVLIFKHSTTCGISASAFHRMNESFEELSKEMDLYYLDLLTYRSTSNAVAREFGVIHQSPQVIILQDGEVVYTSSHYAILPQTILGLAV